MYNSLAEVPGVARGVKTFFAGYACRGGGGGGVKIGYCWYMLTIADQIWIYQYIYIYRSEKL